MARGVGVGALALDESPGELLGVLAKLDVLRVKAKLIAAMPITTILMVALSRSRLRTFGFEEFNMV